MTERAKKRIERIMANYNALLDKAKTKDEIALITMGAVMKMLRVMIDEVGDLRKFVEKNL